MLLAAVLAAVQIPAFAAVDQCEGASCPARDALGVVAATSQHAGRIGDAPAAKLASDVAFSEGRDANAVLASASASPARTAGVPTLTAVESPAPAATTTPAPQTVTPPPGQNKGLSQDDLMMYGAGAAVGAAAGLTKALMGFGLWGPLGMAFGGALVGIGVMHLFAKNSDTYGALGAAIGGMVGAVALSAVLTPWMGPFLGAAVGTVLGGAAGGFLGNFLGGLFKK